MISSSVTQTDSKDLVLSLFPTEEIASSLNAPSWLPLGWAALPYPKGLNLVHITKEPQLVPRCDLHVLVLPKTPDASLSQGQVTHTELPQFSCLYTQLPNHGPNVSMPTQYKLLRFVTTLSEVLEILTVLETSYALNGLAQYENPPSTHDPVKKKQMETNDDVSQDQEFIPFKKKKKPGKLLNTFSEKTTMSKTAAESEGDGILCQDAQTGQMFFIARPEVKKKMRLAQTQLQSNGGQDRVIVRCPECQLCFSTEEEYEVHSLKGELFGLKIVIIVPT
jgi:uncharacterized C2H2 Zn-finger protein